MMMRELIRTYGLSYATGIILLMVCIYVQTLSPIVLGNAVGALNAQPIDKSYVGRCAIYLVAIAFAVFFLRFSWRYLIIGGSRHIERILRERLCEKYQSLPVEFYHNHRSGDLMAYAINDIGAVRMAFGPGFSHLLTGIATTVFSLFSMTGVVHAGLTVAALSPIPVALAGILVIGRTVRKRFRRVQAQFAALSGHVNENIMGMRVIKTFVQEEAQERLYEAESQHMMHLNIGLVRASAAMAPILQMLFGLSFAISISYGGSLVSRGVITLGEFTTFNAYLLMVMHPIVATGRIVTLLQRGQASMKRLKVILDEPGVSELDTQPDDTVSAYDITAKSLRFRYPGANHDALEDISFTLQKGRTLGVVGPTGCGKSTLLHLIMKFYETPENMLFTGDRDIRAVSAYAIRQKIGYVPQEGFLFSGTIADNISFYAPSATEKSIQLAASQAGLQADMEQLPGGYNTPVGERGAQVSGGQRQRIALARALIRNPQLLLLDDTLSAVDNQTQQHIIDALRQYGQHCSAIIVSHKLSAVQHADEIIYLEHGKVLERGTHEALLRLGGAYSALWAHQQKQEGTAS